MRISLLFPLSRRRPLTRQPGGTINSSHSHYAFKLQLLMVSLQTRMHIENGTCFIKHVEQQEKGDESVCVSPLHIPSWLSLFYLPYCTFCMYVWNPLFVSICSLSSSSIQHFVVFVESCRSLFATSVFVYVFTKFHYVSCFVCLLSALFTIWH